MRGSLYSNVIDFRENSIFENKFVVVGFFGEKKYRVQINCSKRSKNGMDGRFAYNRNSVR